MAYSTYTTIKTRATVALSDLTAEEAAASIAWADARIDSRIRSRYTLPFASTPTELAEISADLAAYDVLRNRFLAGAEDASPEAAKELRERAESELALLAEGKITLAIGGTATAVSSGMRSSTYGATPSLRRFDGLNRPTYDPADYDPIPAPLTPMIQTAGEGVDSPGGAL